MLLITNTFFLRDIIVVSSNYNILAVGLCFAAIRLYMKVSPESRKFYFYQGFLFFLIFMVKQNIGIFYFIFLIICELMFHTSSLKAKFKNFLYFIFPTIMGSVIYTIYLVQVNSLWNFLDYVFLGLIIFKQNASIESYIIFLALINIIPYFILWKKGKVEKEQKELFICSMIMLLITYPILCSFHSKIALIFSIISFWCLIDKKVENIKMKSLKYIFLIILLIIMCYMTIKNITFWYHNQIVNKQNPYSGAVYNEYMENRINTIAEYIKNSDKKVVMISPESYLYNIPLNINNGILDFPVKGNLGLSGEQKIINSINELHNVRIIITKYKYYQEYDSIHYYIEKNYRKIETIKDVYEIYEK